MKATPAARARATRLLQGIGGYIRFTITPLAAGPPLKNTVYFTFRNLSLAELNEEHLLHPSLLFVGGGLDVVWNIVDFVPEGKEIEQS